MTIKTYDDIEFEVGYAGKSYTYQLSPTLERKPSREPTSSTSHLSPQQGTVTLFLLDLRLPVWNKSGKSIPAGTVGRAARYTKISEKIERKVDIGLHYGMAKAAVEIKRRFERTRCIRRQRSDFAECNLVALANRSAGSSRPSTLPPALPFRGSKHWVLQCIRSTLPNYDHSNTDIVQKPAA
ncbi:hypothetical protein PENSPDRAFT_723396 [Peniophora sp. CONT]|nr:hypothetical protein PENSPDRAFT_723396 [Peniophora sp. CONT]